MTIAISITAIIEDILASSALGAILSDKAQSQAPALLTHDHTEALRRMTANAAGTTALQLRGSLLSVGLPDDPDEDIVTFEYDDSADGSAESLRIYFENAVRFGTLQLIALASGEPDKADTYGTCARETAETISTVIAGVRNAPPILPSYY